MQYKQPARIIAVTKFESPIFRNIADVANFTAWSSVREPVQVFTLLEGVYNKFDAIAKKRRVFKVSSYEKQPTSSLSCFAGQRFNSDVQPPNIVRLRP